MKVGDPITRLIAPTIGNREMKEKDKVRQRDQLHWDQEMTNPLLEGGGAEVMRTGLLGSGIEVKKVITLQHNRRQALRAWESKSVKDWDLQILKVGTNQKEGSQFQHKVVLRTKEEIQVKTVENKHQDLTGGGEDPMITLNQWLLMKPTTASRDRAGLTHQQVLAVGTEIYLSTMIEHRQCQVMYRQQCESKFCP